MEPQPTPPRETAYSDQTGRFPHISSRGNQYSFVLYDYDGNTILAKAIKNRKAKVIANAIIQTYDWLTRHGHEVKAFVLDNECYNILKLAILDTKAKYQLLPPPQH